MAAALPTFDQFRTEMLAAGYDEVLERPWGPDTVMATHTHPFDANGLVVQGEFWLQCEGGAVRHLQPGDRFQVPRMTPHHEKYGPQGATFWVARRN